MKSFFLKLMLIGAMFTAAGTLVPAMAQEAAAPAAAAAEDAAPDAGNTDVTLWNIVYGDSIINLLIWILLFGTSMACIGLIIDAIMNVKADKIMPRELAETVREALQQGDLGVALEACENMPSPLSNILTAGLNNVENGYSVVVDSVSTAAEIETEKLMQRVNLLNLVGAIAPMLGLMGTVVGMVLAFGTLAQASGANKAALLAVNISIALYTTLYGLLVSVPAILGFTFTRNHANKLILTMEMLTYDLIKVLRDAEVVGDSE